MNFQSKMSLVYLLFILILVVTLGIIIYISSVNMLEKNARDNLGVLVDKMSLQLDNLIRPMDFISLNLLSDGEFFSSIKTLAAMDKSKVENHRFINDAYMKINSALLNYTIGRDYYSVNVFNTSGDVFSSNINFSKKNINYSAVIESIPWLELVKQNKGRIIISSPHQNPWGDSEDLVFSVTRTARGTDLDVGYIQVQEPYETLEKLFYVEEDSSISVLALTRENNVLYNKGIEHELLDFYCDLAKQGKRTPESISIPGSVSDQIVTVAVSNYTGVHILLAQDKQAIMRPLSAIKITSLIASVSTVALSYIYILVFSRYLTKPLRILKEEIEKTHFENLPYEIDLSNSVNNDEIKALNTAFIKLRERLYDSMEKEIESRNLYLQASLESLQARINPHFIYNILNLLSNRGIMHGDTVICDICKSIASMLRYSTSTKNLTASLEDELEHVENYLSIMKTRFEHRLEYTIDIDQDLLSIKLPKIVLQPLVENSINHGYVDVDKTMEISIYGYKKDGRWIIEIHDNGQGFDSDKLRELNEKIKAAGTGDRIAEEGKGIGGMGILNLYSRLILYFDKDDFKFTLLNKKNGGACVIISNPLNSEEVT